MLLQGRLIAYFRVHSKPFQSVSQPASQSVSQSVSQLVSQPVRCSMSMCLPTNSWFVLSLCTMPYRRDAFVIVIFGLTVLSTLQYGYRIVHLHFLFQPKDATFLWPRAERMLWCSKSYQLVGLSVIHHACVSSAFCAR